MTSEIRGTIGTARTRALLEILADGEPHSGEDIGSRLGVSRAAVWKLVDQARRAGLDIRALPGAGYRLPAPLTLLDAGRISEALGTDVHHYRRLEVRLATGSTNQDLLQDSAPLDHPVALLAEHQSAGRGRRGRHWLSPMGASLYLSVAWPLGVPVAGLSGLSLVAGLAVAEAVDQICDLQVGLKWPNDLYVGRRKIGGILVEVSGSPEGPCKAVIGSGLNCRFPEGVEDTDIDQPWTDLYRASGIAVDRNQLAAAILAQYARDLPVFERDGFTPFVERWNRRDILLDQPVILQLGQESATGIARGVSELGALVLEENGRRRSIAGGDVSLRPDRP